MIAVPSVPLKPFHTFAQALQLFQDPLQLSPLSTDEDLVLLSSDREPREAGKRPPLTPELRSE